MARTALLSLILALSAALSPGFLPDLVPKRGALEGAAFAAAQDADQLEACALAPNEEAVPSSGRAIVDRIELELFHLANEDRARNGLPPLQFDHQLLDIARARAGAHVAAGPLSHADGDEGMAYVRLIDEMDLGRRLVGENLIRVSGHPGGAAERAEQGFMNSPAHRANILDPTFETLAVGAAIEASCQIVLVQIFRAEGRR